LGRLAPVFAAAALGWACAHAPVAQDPAAVHVVERGDTIWRIAKRYGVAMDEVIRVNRIADVRALAVGTRLRLPGAPRTARAPVVPAAYTPPIGAPAPAAPELPDAALRETDLAFGWPVHGPLNSPFGERGSRHHAGVDLGAPRGTPVRAVEAGRVIYSERLGDYGNVVIVKHVGDWSSVYAHNSRNHVETGQMVEKGTVVAEVGASGNATHEHLHFELRRGQSPVDPLRYLP
jgi:murein DD-endopeptidase MepM/ murein hydrolase activator NlpD